MQRLVRRARQALPGGTSRAADRMQLSDVRFDVAFDNAPIGVALLAPDGRWLHVNQALLHITGYTRDELLERDFQSITHPDDLDADVELVRRVLSRELETYELDKRYIHASGHVIWAQLNVSLVRNAGGEPLYFISQIQDITGRRQLEEQLRQSQKLEAVGRLAGGVAHDFNNLLTVISGYSELAIQRVADGQPGADGNNVRDDLDEIRIAAARAGSLTQQLLAFSRQQVVQPELLELNTVVTELEKMLQRLIGDDVSLAVKLDPTAGWVVADAGQLEQVILNLVINGRDAIAGGGMLTIATAPVEVEQSLDSEHGRIDTGRYVSLAVTDSGAGMDAATRALIFEPFFTTKEPGKGTGLGLSTVFGILEQSKGHIRVETPPGGGTSFTIYLPEAQHPEQTEAAPAAARPTGGTETILLAEDEPTVRELVSRMLEGAGYRVLAAANGSDALQLCAEHRERIDLLLTDIVMPEMSGVELARRVALVCPELGVLYMSGYTDNAINPELAGTVSFLQKPFTLQELLDAVGDAVKAQARSED